MQKVIHLGIKIKHCLKIIEIKSVKAIKEKLCLLKLEERLANPILALNTPKKVKKK